MKTANAMTNASDRNLVVRRDGLTTGTSRFASLGMLHVWAERTLTVGCARQSVPTRLSAMVPHGVDLPSKSPYGSTVRSQRCSFRASGASVAHGSKSCTWNSNDAVSRPTADFPTTPASPVQCRRSPSQRRRVSTKRSPSSDTPPASNPGGTRPAHPRPPTLGRQVNPMAVCDCSADLFDSHASMVGRCAPVGDKRMDRPPIEVHDLPEAELIVEARIDPATSVATARNVQSLL